MRRLIGSVLAVLIFLPSPPTLAAGFVTTLGISFIWGIEETKKAFADAGIAPKDFRGDRQLETRIKEMIRGLLASLSPVLIADDFLLGSADFARLSPQECLYYENAPEPRDDIALVTVCFYGKERQVMIVPFFREDKVDSATLRRYLMGEYGEPKNNKEDEKDIKGVRVLLWTQRPWFYAKLLTSKYIFLFEIPPHAPRLPGISGLIAYVNALQLNDAIKDLKAEDDAAKAAAEKAKQDARKGL